MKNDDIKALLNASKGIPKPILTMSYFKFSKASYVYAQKLGFIGSYENYVNEVKIIMKGKKFNV